MIQLPYGSLTQKPPFSTPFWTLDCEHLSPSDKIFPTVEFAQLGSICHPVTTHDQDEIKVRLKEAHEGCERLREENDRLRGMLGISHSTRNQNVPQGGLDPKSSPLLGRDEVYAPERKIALFRNLFRGREDVFAIQWEGKRGKSGYLPAGAMDWHAIYAAKPEDRKKVGRKTRILQPLTDEVIKNHLTGKQTVGIYPLLPDETCWFLAVDFDKKSWIADSTAFVATCRHFHIPAFVERSRSGNGAHVRVQRCKSCYRCAQSTRSSLSAR